MSASNCAKSSFVFKESLETELRITAETPENLVSAVIRSGQFRKPSKNNDELADFKADTFHEVLNRFIEKGITFEVSADDFQTVDRANALKISDKEFLKLNNAAILCQLQQSLLMKHLFTHSPEQFEDFAFEISDKELLMSDSNITAYELYRAAVMDVTRIWFENLLKNLFL